VLPLYPGFIALMSNRLSKDSSKKSVFLLGVLVALGVVAFMFIIGWLFTTFLQASLTNVIGIVSPIAFLVLLVISILLIFDFDVGKFIPRVKVPRSKSAIWSALGYGFFFGAIVIPCNPLFIAALFTKTLTVSSFVVNMFNFLLFGIGMALPLLILALVSANWSNLIVGFLARRKRYVNLIAGLIMLTIAFYYLTFVFNIWRWFI